MALRPSYPKNLVIQPYEWLIDHSQRFLLYEGNTHSLVGVEQLAASEVSMLQLQVQLRRRAGKRFPRPEKWLWTARSFSQASDWYSAQFKASIVPEGCRVVDGCCAAGSDLVALAQRGPAIGIDLDPELVALARHNLAAHQMCAEVQKSDLLDCESWIEREDWLHVDPDRGGPEGKTNRSDKFSPSLQSVLSLAKRTTGSLVKVAPSTQFTEPEELPLADLTRLWIGNYGECKQQLLCLGAAAGRLKEMARQSVRAHADKDTAVRPIEYLGSNLLQNKGVLRWAVLANPSQEDKEQTELHLFAAEECKAGVEPEEIAFEHSELGQYIYDLHNTAHAAQLQASFAEAHQLTAITSPNGYFTKDEAIESAWLQRFRLLDIVAWDDRKMRKCLRGLGAGVVEVKNRLVKLDANHYQKRFSGNGTRKLTLIVTQLGRRTRCLVCERGI